jgi:TRAP-type C4-dicarboxylate transport system permease small subunit
LPWLEKLARACAALAGVLLTLIALMTCASVLGRNLLGASLAGDFELTGAAAALAIALFMPLCQARQGHIVVDFFTSGLSRNTTHALDRAGCILTALVMGLLAWRTTLGGVNAWNNHTGTMLLGLPEWLIYAGMAPPLALTGVIAFWQSIAKQPPHALEVSS